MLAPLPLVLLLLAAGPSADQEISFGIEVAQKGLWREARLRDPSGNPICLFAAGANRLNPPWRIQESLA